MRRFIIMTKAQINYLLSLKDLNSDEWISLNDAYPMLCLKQDSNVYVREDARYFFNSSTEILEIRYGKKDNDGNFIFLSSSVDCFISYDIIYEFVQTVRPTKYGTYYSII